MESRAKSLSGRQWLLLITGLVALWIEIAYTFGAAAGGLSEPFPNVERYFAEVWSISLLGTAFFGFALAILGVIGIILGAFGVVGASESLAKVSIALFLPIVAWATLLAFNGTNDPAFNLHVPAPDWMASPVIQVLGTGWGFIVFPSIGMAACIFLIVRANLRTAAQLGDMA